jgi:hypothetical protein
VLTYVLGSVIVAAAIAAAGYAGKKINRWWRQRPRRNGPEIY